MSYKRHKPIDVSEMDKTRWLGHHSICQMLRDIYHETNDDEIKIKCRIAMSMAKSMHNKIKALKKELGATTGGKDA